MQALDVEGPLDVFAEANGFLGSDEGYAIVVTGDAVRAMRTSNRMSMISDMDFAGAAMRFGTVLVAGGPQLPGRAEDATLSRWLCDWATQAERYGAICTGAFALGQARLLDERAANTHWQKAARLSAMFPRARIEPDRIHLRDGPLVTSAGLTAAINLALALAQRHVLEHPAAAHPVERLAGIAETSTRLFTGEMGITPQSARATGLALKAIAYDCGFAVRSGCGGPSSGSYA